MSGDEDHILYRHRPEWSDVTPLPVERDKDSVIKICFSESFNDCYSYLRAVLRSGELSERVFELTTTCVEENPSCYTVWLLRRRVIVHLKKNIREELHFMTTQIQENQKNYQVWHHRQKLIEWLGDATGELEFILSMLEWDAKNYHAWQYRQWILKKFDLWEGELDVCDSMLKTDCRNNSAWNQRYFVIENTTGFTEEVVDRELEFTLDSINDVNFNESSWNYLRGLLRHANDEQRTRVVHVLESLSEAEKTSVYLLSTLLDEYIKVDKKHRALEIVGQLKAQDVLRSDYWDFRSRLLQED